MTHRLSGDLTPDERSPLSPRNVAIGIGLFLVFTAAGLAAVAWWASRSDAEVISELTHASRYFLLVALLLTVVEAIAGGFRIWVRARLCPDSGFGMVCGHTSTCCSRPE